jgi:hypothetical protein
LRHQARRVHTYIRMGEAKMEKPKKILFKVEGMVKRGVIT